MLSTYVYLCSLLDRPLVQCWSVSAVIIGLRGYTALPVVSPQDKPYEVGSNYLVMQFLSS